MQGDDVLRGGDWGRCAADVGGKRDAKNEGFGKGRVGRKVAEKRLKSQIVYNVWNGVWRLEGLT